MVGAGEVAGMAAAPGNQTTAVPTGIGEGARDPITGTHQKQRDAGDLQRQIIAGSGDLLLARGKYPFSAKYALDLPREERRLGIAPTRQIPGFAYRAADRRIMFGREQIIRSRHAGKL